MKIFYLPDLGEGLAEAEIREWYVKVGDEVKVDQPLVSMETAKAVVDVPSPQAGKIAALHGKPFRFLLCNLQHFGRKVGSDQIESLIAEHQRIFP